jgi:threonyl-tRNA synthetase
MENTLYNIRHSLAHLLAIASLGHDPKARLSVGPVTENGFYYDIDFSEGNAPTPEDLKTLEKTMRKLINKKLPFVRQEVSIEEARERFADNPYKLAILDDIEKAGETVSLYTTGEFTDLCEGRHVENTGDIDGKSFTLTHLAGAYFRGDENKPMLTRIYGLAFATEAELKAYLAQQEEAKKRDHRKLGKELGLFVFSELVGPGLPLWTPKGTIIRELLNDYVWELRRAYGYQKVTIPHITKKDLYETSGHWSKFADELFRITTREKHLYALKPMNCPHHTQIFAAEQRSYRDMPERYCETTMVYRDEQSGELSGLSRVLSITQDDAHVFCRENQIEQEVYAVWDIVDHFYKTFGFDLAIRFSRHDPAQKEKYLGDSAVWEHSENALRTLIEKRGITALDGLGEAAMYGPKIDFIAKDSLGRTWQIATIQLDFNQPKNFDLFCINEKGEKEPIVMIHCAIMGSLERFISILIEHYAGAFPVWLAPVQAVVLPIGENHRAFAQEVREMLRKKNIRAELDASNESLGKRVRNAKVRKIPYLLVIGDKEVEAKSVALEHRSEGSLGTQSLDRCIDILEQAIASKR